MTFSVVMIPKEKFFDLSEDLHKICFSEIKPKELERIDFALAIIDDEKNQMAAYTTCKELDGESLYFQYGGDFPEYRGKDLGKTFFHLFLNWIETTGYKRLGCLIENDNKGMLKIASQASMKIIGLRNYKGKILLEHGIEFGNRS